MYFGYIYYTKNEITGKMYIGKITTRSLYKNKSYKGSGVDLLKAVEEYGKENFSVHYLAAARNGEELTLLEKYYLEYYNIPNDKFYNKNLATSNSEQSNYFNGNNVKGVNLKNIICYNIKTNQACIFNNITQFCKANSLIRGNVFNVMSGQRITHKDCVFWYEDYPLSSDGLNWILNYKLKTNYKTKYTNINEVKAELNELYSIAQNKKFDFIFNGYYIEDNKELEIDWDEIKQWYSSLIDTDGKMPMAKAELTKVEVERVKDSKYEDKNRPHHYVLKDTEKSIYFEYEEIADLCRIYSDLNNRILRQAINRKQKTVMNKKYELYFKE